MWRWKSSNTDKTGFPTLCATFFPWPHSASGSRQGRLPYFELWVKYQAKAATPGAAPASLPVFPDPNAGLKPETLAYIEKTLNLM